MPYRLIEDDPAPEHVRRMTFVPFLPDGRCLVLPGPALPSGEMVPGEYYLLDTCIRIPMEALGFRFQRVHPFAADGDHVYAWLDGDRRAPGPGETWPVEDLAARLPVVRDAAHSFRTQSDESYYADNLRVIEPAYLRGPTPQAGSGFGGDATRWRARRALIVDGVHRSGTFLDVGCANGLLMESVREWAAERGVALEPPTPPLPLPPMPRRALSGHSTMLLVYWWVRLVAAVSKVPLGTAGDVPRGTFETLSVRRVPFETWGHGPNRELANSIGARGRIGTPSVTIWPLTIGSRRGAGLRPASREPYGVDLGPRLVDLARQRLPRWADRIEVGNAIDYAPGRTFTFVHTLLDTVPKPRRADLVHHLLTLVEPGGRLLVSHYTSPTGTDHSAGEYLRAMGFPVAGTAAAEGATTAWLESGH